MALKLEYSLITFSLFLISLDAYEAFFIPITWIGHLFLFIISLKYLANVKVNKNYLTFFLILLLPGLVLTIININKDDLTYTILRVFNIISYFLVYFYFKNYKVMDLDLIFNKYIKILINIVSLFAVYIFFAQIFDLPEIYRNRPGTSFFNNTEQATFWLSQPHRAMGTFREPSFLVAFLLPLLYLYQKNYKYNSYSWVILPSVTIGLTRSDYAKIICILIIFLEIFFYIQNKSIDVKILLMVSLIYFFSTFGILECNINPNSKDCSEYKEVVAVINNSKEIKIKAETNTPVQNLDNERINSIVYFYKLIDDLNPSGLSNVNSQFQIYSYNTILDEMYLTNRTLPQYLLIRYDAQNFGTGNYSLLNYRLNIQNIIFFYTSAFGLQLLIAFVIYLIFIIFKYKFNKNSLIFLLTISIFLISPIEEVNSFYGILLGFCAAKLNTKITEDE